MVMPTNNGDESIDFTPDCSTPEEALFLGNFHKTLPHNQYGEVDSVAYRKFKGICNAVEQGMPVNFEDVPKGSPILVYPHDMVRALRGTAKFTSPLAGASTESLGPLPKSMEMIPAPSVKSHTTAAEMVELYWMAYLRDKDIYEFCSSDPEIQQAVEDISKAYTKAQNAKNKTWGDIEVGLDIPETIDVNSLFRCGLKDEEFGPLVSQFFLHDIAYGTQTIVPDQFPYAAGRDFLVDYKAWLHAQNTGKDSYGRDYANCNYFADDPAYYEKSKRKIATMRDLARFVNRDALHQAYFNAALFLDSHGAKIDSGNPYSGTLYTREGGFATLGGPDLLTLVSEVASRALKVVWRQKWLVHRRCRPEVYGGLLHVKHIGADDDPALKRNYDLNDADAEVVLSSAIAGMLKTKYGKQQLLLPMAFSAGSPAHPAYGAGHATVAGACVTVLKAWFDEDQKFESLFTSAAKCIKGPKEPPSPLPVAGILYPSLSGPTATPPTCLNDKEVKKISSMTVGGELNKVAANVAMGRSMGGVHWRTDNTRSLRLGEQIAIEILKKRTLEYAEYPVSFTFTSFDKKSIRIANGEAIYL
ncbi:hypothetical protein D0C16_14890 [Cellvibrio sp. KY-GH-1]|uniref:vanadium-dependent haloperoxidase n=1 Tax=Cellvibrio sp. KY-GH-1 TaxID=2303332 RepID=UPI00124797C7|nr:vanadium-dependent haloperoxidase [Cellvibrio sp. KY-GH-1]QEY17151.1 hypothetical protein D0C16_14890 [Cellvibrio sp. KY-GH-1]